MSYYVEEQKSSIACCIASKLNAARIYLLIHSILAAAADSLEFH